MPSSPRRRTTAARLSLLTAVVSIPLCLTPPQAQPIARADAPKAPTAQAPDDIVSLARTGRFADLLTTLNAQPANRRPAALVADLGRYLQADRDRTDAQKQAADEALAEARAEHEAGNTEDGMVAAIKAHSLAPNPQAVLEDPTVLDLARVTLERAQAAEQAHDWVEAISLYRLLNLLYQDTKRFQPDLQRIATHIRVLQLYAPDQLRDLYAQRDARLGREKKPDNDGRDPVIDDEIELDQWDTRLDGVTFDMLRFALQRAGEQHVDKQPFADLVAAAMINLRTFLDTEGLEDTFPVLNNREQRQAFRRYLDQQIERLQQPGVELTRFPAQDRLQDVLGRNADTLKLPPAVVIYELTLGMTDALDDFSSVIWPTDLERFTRDIDGKFFGIGVQIRRVDGKLTVVTPIPGTPAQRAGIRADDVIMEVDGQATVTWSLDKAVRRITGDKGTVVILGIERPGNKDLLQVPITRDQIDIESIKGWAHATDGSWDFWLDKDSGIGYVRMTKFIPQSAAKLDEAVDQLREDGELKGLILDLRFNPGGLLSSAIDIVDRFITTGEIVSTRDRNRRERLPFRARRAGTYPGSLDLVILINQGSASASEIVSGALQHHDRALVIGQRSYGKGSVQNLYPIAYRPRLGPDGKPLRSALGPALREPAAYLKLTTEYYLIPDGRVIHRRADHTPADPQWGITPDLLIPMTDEQVADALELRQEVDIVHSADEPVDPDNPRPTASDIRETGVDPQLEAAVIYLKALQAATDLRTARVDQN
ncbi:MAG: S41 family peptidase [Planctomycetota bacterium]